MNIDIIDYISSRHLLTQDKEIMFLNPRQQ